MTDGTRLGLLVGLGLLSAIGAALTLLAVIAAVESFGQGLATAAAILGALLIGGEWVLALVITGLFDDLRRIRETLYLGQDAIVGLAPGVGGTPLELLAGDLQDAPSAVMQEKGKTEKENTGEENALVKPQEERIAEDLASGVSGNGASSDNASSNSASSDSTSSDSASGEGEEIGDERNGSRSDASFSGDRAGLAGWLPDSTELRRLLRAVQHFMHCARRQDRGSEAADDRLAAVLSTIEDGMVVITEAGLVSLVNGPAQHLFGRGPIAVGTSVFAALDRTDLDDLLADAASGTKTVRGTVRHVTDNHALAVTVRDLPGHAGAVLRFPAQVVAEEAPAAVLDWDFSLHDMAPEAVATADTLLSDLPVTVLDCETTGLDVVHSRVVSVAAVRMHGATLYRGHVLDYLVNPRSPIPRRTTRIHGITDAMVQSAPDFAGVVEDLQSFLTGTVMVGHSVGFDLAILQAESSRYNTAWQNPPWLDTARLAVALWPDLTRADLEVIAARLHVPVRGRHTALGDVLVIADVFERLLTLLQAQGVRTLGDALEFSNRASHLIALQQRAGWDAGKMAPGD